MSSDKGISEEHSFNFDDDDEDDNNDNDNNIQDFSSYR